MAVQVKVPTIMRKHSGGNAKVEASGDTLDALLTDLETNYPGITKNIRSDDGGLHRFINIYVNDEDVRYLQGLETPVAEGDVISILPAVAGGYAHAVGGDAQHHPRAGNREYAASRAADVRSTSRCPPVGQTRGRQPVGECEGPRRAGHAGRGRGTWRSASGHEAHHHRADQRQYGHRLGLRLRRRGYKLAVTMPES